jgi:GDP-4-dehydro-6-deoxy-D-mannose reductase
LSERIQSVLVTGAAGWCGRHLAAHLRQSAPGVRVLGSDLRDEGPDGVAFQRADLSQPGALSGLLASERPSAIVHLAAEITGESAERLWRTNVGATVALLESVLETPGYRPRVLVVGSAAEYAPADGPQDERSPKLPVTLYGLSKLAQTQIGLAYERTREMDVVVARPFNLLGPGLSRTLAAGAFAAGIAERLRSADSRPLEVGDLGASRDFTDVRDAVAAYATLLSEGRSGREYNVCSGRATPLQSVLDAMLVRAGARVLVKSAVASDRSAEPRVSVGNPARLRTETSWRPRIALEQSIADTLDSHLRS